MTSQLPLTANRLDMEKPTGPTTEAGKESSKKQTLKHRSTSKILLADEVEQLVVARLEGFAATFPVETEIDRWYLHQVALESVRIEQAQELEIALKVDLANRAASCWHDDRASDAADLFEKIVKRPEKTVRELEKTRQGCDRLIAQWDLLACVPKAGLAWNACQRGMALDLLGMGREAREIRDDCPHSVEGQLALADAEIDRLRKRRTDALDGLDESRREAAMRGLVRPDRDLKLVRRYEAMSRRVFDDAIRHLESRGMASQKRVVVQDDRRSADAASWEVLVNELRAMEARADAVLDPLPPAEKAFEPVSELKNPEPKPGNRRARRAAEAAKRKRGR